MDMNLCSHLLTRKLINRRCCIMKVGKSDDSSFEEHIIGRLLDQSAHFLSAPGPISVHKNKDLGIQECRLPKGWALTNPDRDRRGSKMKLTRWGSIEPYLLGSSLTWISSRVTAKHQNIASKCLDYINLPTDSLI